MYSARLVLYESKTGILRACLEAVYVILWIYHAQREVRRYLNTHPHIACLLEFRNLYEVSKLQGFAFIPALAATLHAPAPLLDGEPWVHHFMAILYARPASSEF